MSRFPLYRQHDSMQCGIACLQMVCAYHGQTYSLDELSQLCFATTEGVSLKGICEAAEAVGLHSVCGRVAVETLADAPLPCILHWNQNHFVVLRRVDRKGRRYRVADPARGLVDYSREEFLSHWASTRREGEDRGIALFLQPTPAFTARARQKDEPAGHRPRGERRSLGFLLGYVRQYRRYFGQIVLGLAVGCVLQLIFPFLTQAIVDVGIVHRDIGFIYLILAGQLMLTVSRTAVDFIRRWLLLHISMRINISLLSDFFIKLLRLPMNFFDTKLLGDLMQRMGDHQRVESFLTTQVLSVMFSLVSFVVFGCVLLGYSLPIFLVFAAGSACYAGWIVLFL